MTKIKKKKSIPGFPGAKSYSSIPKVLFFYIFDLYSLIILCLGYNLYFICVLILYVLRKRRESC